MRSPTLLPTRMNAAETSASSAIADWTPLTVVSRSRTTDEIDTFISDVSTTSTNIAIESSTASRWVLAPSSGAFVPADSLIPGPRSDGCGPPRVRRTALRGQCLRLERLELLRRDRTAVEELLGLGDLGRRATVAGGLPHVVVELGSLSARLLEAALRHLAALRDQVDEDAEKRQ